MNASERKYYFSARVWLRLFAILVAVICMASRPEPALAQAPLSAPGSTDTSSGQDFDNAAALRISQSAIGNKLQNYSFTNSSQERVHLADFRGKPVIISLVYSSCYHTCPMTTQHLTQAVSAARQALGADSFTVLTIGFDTPNDTPQAMADFMRQLHITPVHWQFLSTDAVTMQRLIKDLGFIYKPSAKGFDHLIQASVLDANGELYRQVYGELFEIPALVEPLKQLQFGHRVDDTALTDLVKKVRLFCTTYDPASGQYRFDYSLFIGMAVGLMVISGAVTFLVRSLRGPKIS